MWVRAVPAHKVPKRYLLLWYARTLLVNIRFVLKNPATKTLAYFASASLMKKNVFFSFVTVKEDKKARVLVPGNSF